MPLPGPSPRRQPPEAWRLGAEVDGGAGVARRVAMEFGPSENSLLVEDQVMSVDRM